MPAGGGTDPDRVAPAGSRRHRVHGRAAGRWQLRHPWWQAGALGAPDDFDNEEAVGYLADRLARLGVEEALAKAGAQPGCLVRIGTFEFDWQPEVYAGADFQPGQRGSDYRLEEGTSRPSASVRLAARKADGNRTTCRPRSSDVVQAVDNRGGAGRRAASMSSYAEGVLDNEREIERLLRRDLRSGRL